jgi:hypothetical protein
MSLFLSFYDNPYYKNLICPRAQLKTLAPRVVGECPPQKDIFYLEINYTEQNGYLKILIGCVWGDDERGGGVVTLQLLSTITKGTSHSNFQLNEPFLKFLRQLLPYEVPGYGEERKK